MAGLVFSAEQIAFAEVVNDVLGARCSTQFVAEASSNPNLRAELWTELTAVGIPALAVPEKDGGLALGAVDLACVSESAGAFAAPVPLVSTAGMFVPLLSSVADDWAHDLLREVSVGTTTGTICYSVHQPLPQLRRDALAGGERFIGEARADWIAIPAELDKGDVGLVVVRKDALGVTELESIDPTRPVGRVRLMEGRVKDLLVSRLDPTQALCVALSSLAAELIGLGQQLVSATIEHALNREQFGRPIGAFQAVKHRLIDAHIAVELARSLVYRAAVIADDSSATHAARRRAAFLAKGAASEAALQAAQAAIQIHGGIGLSRDHKVSLLYLRARQAAAWLGTPDRFYVAATAESA